jgi:hypothetical protein
MVPSALELVTMLPTLPSGKVDRKALPRPAGGKRKDEGAKAGTAPATELERAVHARWAKLFFPQTVAMEDDFFALGGHSLLATRLLSDLRQDPRFAAASVLSLYNHPTLAAFCVHLAGLAAGGSRAGGQDAGANPGGVGEGRKAGAWSYAGCVGLQLASLYGLFFVAGLHWVVPLWAWERYQQGGSLPVLGATVLALAVVFAPARMALGVALKWLIIGRFKPGVYPVWSVYYWRFWVVRRALAWLGPRHLAGTPFLAGYYRLLGAKIGRGVHLESTDLVATDLITVEDGATIGPDVPSLGSVRGLVPAAPSGSCRSSETDRRSAPARCGKGLRPGGGWSSERPRC